MRQRIVYPTPEGIAVVTPLDCGMTVVEIARKDVPAGVPFLIVDATDIPTDRTYRAAWACDFSSPSGHGIGPEAWAAEQAQPEPEPEPEPEPAPFPAPSPEEGTGRPYPELPS